MFKKFISILATAAMLMSFAPAALAEETEGIKTEITFGDEYSVVGDTLNVKVKISSGKEETGVTVKISYGEIESGMPEATLCYIDQINLNEENKFTFENDCNITVGTPDKFTVNVNGEITEKEIVKKEAFEIGDVTAEYKQTVTEEEAEYLEYTVKTKIKNNHNVKAEKLVLAYNDFKTEEFSAEAKTEVEKELAVKVKKSDMPAEKLTAKLQLTANGEAAAEKEFEFANPYYVSAITVNGGKKITLAKDEKTTPAVVLEPAGTLSDYTLSVKNEDIISVDEDKKSITGVKAGKTEITVKAGDKTVTAEAEVLRNRTAIEPENIKFYYYKNETEKTDKTEIAPDEAFSYATDSYVVTLPEDLTKSFKLYYEITGGTLSEMKTTRTQSGNTETANVEKDGEETYLDWSNRYIKLDFKFADKDSASTYTFTIGNSPEIPNFSEEIKVYSDFDKNSNVDFTLELALNQYADDPTEITGLEVLDSDGKTIGRYREEGEKESTKRYWKYEISKTTKEGTKQPVTFRFKNKHGMATVRNTNLVYSEDTEDPKWSGNAGISVSSVTSSSATVKWSHATDNDSIAYYILHYYKGSSKGAEKTVKVTYDSTEKPSASISSLSSGTGYTVYVEAFDRTGNSCSSKTDGFTTSKSSSSGGSGSGGSSGGNKNNSSSGNTGWNGGSNNSGTTGGNTTKKTFTDIDNYGWAKNEIETLTGKGIISGISDTEFGPASNIRRCDFILLISRAYGFNGTFEENFSDVPSDAYYATAVGLAKKLGILTGMGNNEFNPNGYITRQDMCVMALRAMKVAGKKVSDPTDISKFADSTDIAEYAKEAVGSLTAGGIIKGDDNGNANPRKNTTRAEAAVIIYRLLGI